MDTTVNASGRIKSSMVTYATILHRILPYRQVTNALFKLECFDGLPAGYNFGGRMSDMEAGGLLGSTKKGGDKKFYFITAKGKQRLKDNEDSVQPTHTDWNKLIPQFTYYKTTATNLSSPKRPYNRKVKPQVEIEYTGAAKAAIDEVGAIIQTNDVAKKLLVETFMQFSNYLNGAEELPKLSDSCGAITEVIRETMEFNRIIYSIQQKIAKGVKSDE